MPDHQHCARDQARPNCIVKNSINLRKCDRRSHRRNNLSASEQARTQKAESN
jgi:hypothetical protein